MSIRPAPIKKPSISEPGKPITKEPYSLCEVLEGADVLLRIVDARDSAAGLSEDLFKVATGKDIILLVNKIGKSFVLSANVT